MSREITSDEFMVYTILGSTTIEELHDNTKQVINYYGGMFDPNLTYAKQAAAIEDDNDMVKQMLDLAAIRFMQLWFENWKPVS